MTESSTTTQPELFANPAPSAELQEGLFAQVVFDRPLDQAYTYRVPAHLRGVVGIGKRVQAPFGKGDRPAVGFCVGITEELPGREVKELVKVLDDESLFTDNLLRLTRWMADYYLCGWGQVLNAVVPAGVKRKAGLREVMFIEAVPESECPQPLPKLTRKQSEVLKMLRQSGGPVEAKNLARLADCGTAVIKHLLQKKMAKRTLRRMDTVDVDGSTQAAALQDSEPTPVIELNGAQQKVSIALLQAIRAGGFKPFLLHGVTGSGKTELYLRAIEEIVQRGQQALVLVPEISLTPQTIQRFQGRYGQVAVLHSHLRDAERSSQWRRIFNGEVQVIVGARSAIFAPAKNLGLIVIDEEHEGSFKQESTPRYHARDVAVMRARLESIPILLGSATPSLESWHNVERGQYTLLELPNRVLDRPMPRVTIVDMRHEFRRNKAYQALSYELEQAIRHALVQGGQIILLLNRRGFSTHVHCLACGHVATCRFCDLALTFHHDRDVNLCHYCGYEEMPPKLCPACGRVYLRYQGMGTEKLQAEIERKFPGYIVRRMDSDTMKRAGSHGKLLSAFRRGEVHILLGTQMIAKGLDFPNVTLVGVVNADVGLHLPDFRASERTFQLLSQVAGRTGRGPRGGHVIIQTFNPEHAAITLAAAHDYASFVEGELAHRREHKYPPYQRLVRVIVRGRKREEAEQFADRFAKVLQTSLDVMRKNSRHPVDIRILGPAEAPIFRLKGYFRFHLQLQSASAGLVHQLLRQVIQTTRVPSTVELTIDVDPTNML